VGNDKAGCPSFETHRYAMLLRMRWCGFIISESALVAEITFAQLRVLGEVGGLA
jgi:hypothetical protein